MYPTVIGSGVGQDGSRLKICLEGLHQVLHRAVPLVSGKPVYHRMTSDGYYFKMLANYPCFVRDVGEGFAFPGILTGKNSVIRENIFPR
jgi:hypothetical protein